MSRTVPSRVLVLQFCAGESSGTMDSARAIRKVIREAVSAGGNVQRVQVALATAWRQRRRCATLSRQDRRSRSLRSRFSRSSQDPLCVLSRLGTSVGRRNWCPHPTDDGKTVGTSAGIACTTTNLRSLVDERRGGA